MWPSSPKKGKSPSKDLFLDLGSGTRLKAVPRPDPDPDKPRKLDDLYTMEYATIGWPPEGSLPITIQEEESDSQSTEALVFITGSSHHYELVRPQEIETPRKHVEELAHTDTSLLLQMMVGGWIKLALKRPGSKPEGLLTVEWWNTEELKVAFDTD